MKKTAKVNELYKQLKTGVEEFYSSDRWKEFLTVQARFHQYSFRNVLLIYMQCPHATRVAGFEDWKKFGRHVKRGETAIKILGPKHRREVDEKTGEENWVLNGFYQASVFDISQTGGEELPSLSYELSKDTPTLRRFYEMAKAISPAPIQEVTLKGSMKGSYNYTTQTISIKKGMAALQKCKTLIHEIAHAMLHTETDKPRELREVEAEGTAFVVLNYFGFDTSEYSFSYVAGWNGSAEHISKAGEAIQKAAVKLIDDLEAILNEKESAA
ncbi:ArdC-like ssDNA-binding domain-containing protein [Paenibacillus chitinolyticus]|uniref:ArdC-like ssDNA-binding domain-containing protein n=1 Tax=Paenibacillus chitinolyticus TaxID=79263 RepID=UPI001C45F22B|nr:ArdC-like ssDNA-binding domain-containing protein [Paenibacillus chitinolyticus]MBV6717277.1 ImmA/IrrE family metallo-endopeptidase [Paenibacillus chitinolyticus]